MLLPFTFYSSDTSPKGVIERGRSVIPVQSALHWIVAERYGCMRLVTKRSYIHRKNTELNDSLIVHNKK